MYNVLDFYIDSLFCRRNTHYKQEQYVSLFFQTGEITFFSRFSRPRGDVHYATTVHIQIFSSYKTSITINGNLNKNLTHAVRNPWFVPVSSILTLHRHRWLLVELFLDKRISIITGQSCYWPKYSFLSVSDLCLRWNVQLWTIWKN